jgi:hypothetical protein
MKKTTLYLPDGLKQRVKSKARKEGRSEADVMRDAITAAVGQAPVRPTVPLFDFELPDPTMAQHIDDFLDGFGED